MENDLDNNMNKVLISGMIGNGFEWYDFALYGQMAFILGHLFFPSESVVAQSMATFAAFAVAFVFRPVGAILFGWIGDKFGRKQALLVAIIMMAIPTGLIGLLPTYDQIGYLAPALLVLIRICQGISLGGEFGGAMTYIVEHSEGHKRGRLGGTTISSLILGFVFGTLVVLAVKHSMSVEDFQSWGWRIPFLLGIIIGVAGLLIRHGCEESPVYEQAKANEELCENPLKSALKYHWRDMLKAMCTYSALTMPFYLVSIFFITYSRTYLGLSTSAALEINIASMMFMLFGSLISAYASDIVGRKKVLVASLVVMSIAATVAMAGMEHGNENSAWMYQTMLGFAVGLYLGPMPAYLVEVFPTSVRYTGMSLAFNGATVIFGGTTPIVCISLLAYFGTPLAIAGYFCLCCLIAYMGLRTYEDRWQEPLT